MTHLQWFLDKSEDYVKTRIWEAKSYNFCGLDEVMGCYQAYYMVVVGFGVCHKVTVTQKEFHGDELEIVVETM